LDKNLIKCKFCDWTTHKWGNGSNPEAAFRRLFRHINDEHWEQADAIAASLPAVPNYEVV
jgi:hypothetical protein